MENKKNTKSHIGTCVIDLITWIVRVTVVTDHGDKERQGGVLAMQ